MRAFVEESIDAEAVATLRAIAQSAVAAFERENFAPAMTVTTHVLCESTAPIPPSLDMLTPLYTSTAAEWTTDRGWSCLRMQLDTPQRFQYEVRLSPGATAFDAIARRVAGADIVEMSIHGERTSGDQLRAGGLQTRRIPHR